MPRADRSSPSGDDFGRRMTSLGYHPWGTTTTAAVGFMIENEPELRPSSGTSAVPHTARLGPPPLSRRERHDLRRNRWPTLPGTTSQSLSETTSA
jgi:hypothetical protein